MGTSYFCLAPPIVSARIAEFPGHTKVALWEGDNRILGAMPKLVGELTFGDTDAARQFMLTLSDHAPYLHPYYHRHDGTVKKYREPTSLTLVSETGETIRRETLEAEAEE